MAECSPSVIAKAGTRRVANTSLHAGYSATWTWTGTQHCLKRSEAHDHPQPLLPATTEQERPREGMAGRPWLIHASSVTSQRPKWDETRHWGWFWHGEQTTQDATFAGDQVTLAPLDPFVVLQVHVCVRLIPKAVSSPSRCIVVAARSIHEEPALHKARQLAVLS